MCLDPTKEPASTPIRKQTKKNSKNNSGNLRVRCAAQDQCLHTTYPSPAPGLLDRHTWPHTPAWVAIVQLTPELADTLMTTERPVVPVKLKERVVLQMGVAGA